MTGAAAATGAGLRVAVIGAGPSGLVATKELLEAGHQPVCFERSIGLGGVFRYDERDGVIWRSCRLTTSGLFTAFSDFPVLPEEWGHLDADGYVAYLERYADAFSVTPTIRFGVEVVRVDRVRSANGDRDVWLVTTCADGATDEHSFDAVAICTGLNRFPARPSIPGEESIARILHSSEYRRAEDFHGQRVLVVGGGETGADLIAELGGIAAESALSLRRGMAVLPRERRGMPNDYRTTRLANSPAPWIAQTRSPRDEGRRRLFTVAFLPFVVLDRVLHGLSHNLERGRAMFAARHEGLAGVRTVIRARRIGARLLRTSGGTLHEQYATKSDAFLTTLARGEARLAGELERFDDGRAVFADGSTFAPEAVIFATGFELRFPFLDEEVATSPRYLSTFALEVGATLAFIGFARPAIGAVPPLAELQARWFAALLSAVVTLPAVERMRERVERAADQRQLVFSAVRGRLDHLVDYMTLCDAVATEIGCKPTTADLRREHRSIRRSVFVGPFVGAQYRLIGPGAKPEQARAILRSLPRGYFRFEELAFVLRWRLSRVLHGRLGESYAPKLDLDRRG